ncbi:CPBP family intramembrane glutamic endopeptidase [Agromyces salentinus]|uniref:CPBP family intramembrane glutamic endopeptidase n=1 Tax=Agromyces salentinus TaxID=269421 RepID=UPI0012FA491E|nr:CPBP family intramembrane glutamic endopeptidase [Agromyces salentinus]
MLLGEVMLVSISLLWCIAVITFLALWPRVLVDSKPTRRWVVIVPIITVIPCLLFTRYDAFLDIGPGFFAATVLMVLVIGASEELLFRGITVELLRNRVSEGWVAFISTMLFGLAHLMNSLAAGVLNLPQVLSAIVVGYLLYLTRRSLRLIIFPILLHAIMDLFEFSHIGTADGASFYNFLFNLALVIVVLACGRLISPRRPSTLNAPDSDQRLGA